MFSVVHHWLHWFDQLGAVDHRPFVASLRTRGIIRLRNRNSGYVLSDTITPNRFQAWCIVTGLWHERLAKEDSLIKGADPRASSLADLVHSLGTARVAAVMAYIFTILILRETCVLSWEVSAIIRFVAGSILTVFFVYLCWDGYRRAGEATQRYVEQVLDDALTQEQIQTRAGVPIDTYFAPSSLEKKMNIRQQALIVVPLII
ncbi:MAG TPA: hypothetical protein VMW42_11345, partial [Desulfatiglandales bacterium]|nr:hypothetical protein [Desulfatiglandales bacterium]